MVAFLLKPTKNHANNITNTKKQTTNTQIATNNGLSAKTIKKPCKYKQTHKRTKRNIQIATNSIKKL